MTITTDEFGVNNQFAIEPQSYIDPKILKQMENGNYKTHNERAEILNGRLAMVGFALAVISYMTTGTIGFGLF